MQLTIGGHTTYLRSVSLPVDYGRDSVIFLHGAAMDHTVWTQSVRHFERHGRNVFAPDLPGHGRSCGEPLTSVAEIASWVVELADRLELTRFSVVGHSMGSLVGLEVAAVYPERVRTLALLGAAIPMAVSGQLLESARKNDGAALDMVTLWGLSESARAGGSPTPGMWMIGQVHRLLEEAAPGVLYADLSACNDYTRGEERASKVACPTLLIMGTRDQMTPLPKAKALAELIPGSTSLLIPSGHSLMVEAPNRVLDGLATII